MESTRNPAFAFCARTRFRFPQILKIPILSNRFCKEFLVSCIESQFIYCELSLQTNQIDFEKTVLEISFAFNSHGDLILSFFGKNNVLSSHSQYIERGIFCDNLLLLPLLG